MVISHKPHPMDTFNPKSFPHSYSSVRQILDSEKPTVTEILWKMIMAHHHPTNLLSMIICSAGHRSSQKVLLAQTGLTGSM